ncbi:MAG: hypothetical protein J6V99_00450 [Neisseriaceae bacterium]|nr:hypothetical protein [Neisseriaceae bacterium]
MNNFFVQKIKSLHPKNHTDFRNFIQVIFLLLIFLLLSFLPPRWDRNNMKIIQFPNSGIYTVVYYYHRNNIGPYFAVKYNGVEYKILCYQPKSTREQVSEICYEENKGHRFIGNDVIIYKSKEYKRKGRMFSESFLLNATFKDYECKANCKTIIIKTPLRDINDFLNRFKHMNVFFLCASLFFGWYLILQIKYRFFNQNEGS